MRNILAADKIAMSLSMICAIHCLLLPVIILTMPTLAATMLGDEAFHTILLYFVIPTSLFSLSMGCKRHRNKKILAAGFIGLSVLILTQILGHDILGETGEKISTLVGSLFIIVSHFKNHQLCKSIQCHKC